MPDPAFNIWHWSSRVCVIPQTGNPSVDGGWCRRLQHICKSVQPVLCSLNWLLWIYCAEQSCPVFSQRLKLRMSERLLPASARSLQATALLVRDDSSTQVHFPCRQQSCLRALGPSWNCIICSLLCLGLPQTFSFSAASESFYGLLQQDQRKGRSTRRRFPIRRPYGVFCRNCPEELT